MYLSTLCAWSAKRTNTRRSIPNSCAELRSCTFYARRAPLPAKLGKPNCSRAPLWLSYPSSMFDNRTIDLVFVSQTPKLSYCSSLSSLIHLAIKNWSIIFISFQIFPTRARPPTLSVTQIHAHISILTFIKIKTFKLNPEKLPRARPPLYNHDRTPRNQTPIIIKSNFTASWWLFRAKKNRCRKKIGFPWPDPASRIDLRAIFN